MVRSECEVAFDFILVLCAVMATTKNNILVHSGKNTRPVTVDSDSESCNDELRSVSNAIREAFSDVINPEQKFFLKVRIGVRNGITSSLIY